MDDAVDVGGLPLAAGDVAVVLVAPGRAVDQDVDCVPDHRPAPALRLGCSTAADNDLHFIFRNNSAEEAVIVTASVKYTAPKNCKD